MEVLWLCLVAFTLTGYAVLDGFDLGAGVVHLVTGKNARDKRSIIRSIGPVWDGNEVWLIAGGGTLFAAFPALFAAGFSSFYMPLMIALWLLALRALAIELQHQSSDTLWLRFWDWTFAGSSTLLALIFGAALANVVRGVPFGEEGVEFVPLWTDFSLRGAVGVIDGYTLLVGATSVVVLAQHGAAWLGLRLRGEDRTRVLRSTRRLWPAATLLALATTAATFHVQPRALENVSEVPVLALFPLLGLAGALALRGWRETRPLHAFLASCALIVGLLGSAATALWPYGLPSSTEVPGLSLAESAASEGSLRVMLLWWIPGMLVATGYSAYVYTRLPSTDDAH